MHWQFIAVSVSFSLYVCVDVMDNQRAGDDDGDGDERKLQCWNKVNFTHRKWFKSPQNDERLLQIAVTDLYVRTYA